MNLCKDCAHFRRSTGRFSPARCIHPELALPEPVYGYPINVSPWDARQDDDVCGPDGIRFCAIPAPTPAESMPTTPKRRWWQL